MSNFRQLGGFQTFLFGSGQWCSRKYLGTAAVKNISKDYYFYNVNIKMQLHNVNLWVKIFRIYIRVFNSNTLKV